MNMPNPVLIRALEIVESGFCQGAFARDSSGQHVTYSSSKACAWCAVGAQWLAVKELRASGAGSTQAWTALTVVMGENVVRYSDSHTKAEVVAAFKAAIEATKEIES